MTELKRPEKTIEDFKQNVLENKMFCSEDLMTIRNHLANFAIVYALGKDAKEKEMDSFLSQVADELERVYYNASEKNNQDFLKILKELRK